MHICGERTDVKFQTNRNVYCLTQPSISTRRHSKREMRCDGVAEGMNSSVLIGCVDVMLLCKYELFGGK